MSPWVIGTIILQAQFDVAESIYSNEQYYMLSVIEEDGHFFVLP